MPFLALEFPLPVKLAELDDKFIRHMKYAFGIALIGSSRLEILSFIFESEKAKAGMKAVALCAVHICILYTYIG